MLKQKTSVLIVGANGTPKTMQVPTLILSHWKKITISIIILIALSFSAILYTVNQQNEKFFEKAYAERISKLKAKNYQLVLDEASNQFNMSEVKKSINEFDNTLNRINEKMRKRGLRTFSLKNAGGPIDRDDENLEELAKFYSNALVDIEKRLDGAPFGRPHNGSITSKYGYRSNPFTGRGREMHSGIDIKGRVGEIIQSTAKGVVKYAGYFGNYGNVVIIEHPNGFETRYAHLSKIKVKRGQYVEIGSSIGLLGNTGRSTGPHLHYEILQNGKKQNPEKYLQF